MARPRISVADILKQFPGWSYHTTGSNRWFLDAAGQRISRKTALDQYVAAHQKEFGTAKYRKLYPDYTPTGTRGGKTKEPKPPRKGLYVNLFAGSAIPGFGDIQDLIDAYDERKARNIGIGHWDLDIQDMLWARGTEDESGYMHLIVSASTIRLHRYPYTRKWTFAGYSEAEKAEQRQVEVLYEQPEGVATSLVDSIMKRNLKGLLMLTYFIAEFAYAPDIPDLLRQVAEYADLPAYTKRVERWMEDLT